MLRRLYLTLILLALLIAPAFGPATPVAAQAAIAWRNLGPAFPADATNLCFDPLQAHTLLAVTAQGTIAYDWTTDTATRLNTRQANGCGGAGYLYSSNPPWRFSSADPAGRAIAHVPTHIADDGSALMYSLERPAPNASGAAGPIRLWASTDAGLTWQQRGQQFKGAVENIAIAEVDAHQIYALAVNRTPTAAKKIGYTVWSSGDAGVTWQQQAANTTDGEAGGPVFSLDVLPGHPAPANQLFLSIRYERTWKPGDTPYTLHEEQVLLSPNRGATFTEVGRRSDQPTSEHNITLVQTAGLLRRTTYYLVAPSSHSSGTTGALDLTTDGGVTWRNVNFPPDSGTLSSPVQSARVAPANLFVQGAQGLWYSPDSAQTWQQIAPASEIVAISPYVPLTLLRKEGTQLSVGELPDASKRLVAPQPVPPAAPTGAYFPTTGHYIPTIFLPYFIAWGDVPQFGFPRTDPIREVSATDGKIYLTQYFERNRFEYHPELAGTKFEIELGLLGNEQTAARRAAGEAPFARVPDPAQPINEVRYFPQTGHTLRDPLMHYWQGQGGLEAYGYPISEPFQEVNPTDGKPYMVQYFERNRLEFHPENVGTPYEVLLGLLGNTLLQQKGWQ